MVLDGIAEILNGLWLWGVTNWQWWHRERRKQMNEENKNIKFSLYKLIKICWQLKWAQNDVVLNRKTTSI